MRVTVTIVANGISRAHIVRDAIDTRRSIARMHAESRKRIIIYACKEGTYTGNRDDGNIKARPARSMIERLIS